jgi:predicted Zn-dependent peptidase
MLNRAVAPVINAIKSVEITKAAEQKLDNGIPLNVINVGSQELIKIEFLFAAGYVYQQSPLVASTVNELIDSGTHKMSACQIADAVDYYGAFLETEVAADFASLSVFTLNKHLDKILPVIEDVIKNAQFPDEEIALNITNKQQRFLVDEQKVNTVARRHFLNLLYGDNTYYGYLLKHADFEKVTKSQLVQFFKQYYNPATCRIIVSGKVSAEISTKLNAHFGGNDWLSQTSINQVNTISPNATKTGENIVLKQDALQSAIRIGRVLFNKTHPDYLPMQVLNTVLGGYFGSRLMSNIREDKGYTYGIGSGIASQKYSGYFFISTEVGVDVCADAINQIYIEINRLREEEISADEMELVRNYMLGSFLSTIDGAFALADRFKGIAIYDLDYDYYDKYLSAICNTTPKQLQELANKYWQKADLTELIVGKK